MLEMLPNRAFFRFEVPIHHIDHVPHLDGHMKKWSLKYMLPALVQVEDEEPFADVYAAWNDDGLYFGFDVPDRPGELKGNVKEWYKYDGVRICVDTRDARDNKRATRFCHLFYIIPTGGGTDKHAPFAEIYRMSRAKEPTPTVDTSKIRTAVHTQRNHYSMDVMIPAACLNGWDPNEHPRIGLFYKVKDCHHGVQNLTVTDDMGWNCDPSQWATGVLVD